MKVVGEARLRGPVDSVWEALQDAGVLTGAIPGCERFEFGGPGLAQFTATSALPAISGTYVAKLTVADQQRPNLVKLTVAASGDQGAVAGDVTLRLSDDADGTTLVSYEANGSVTGAIAGVGTRLLISAAKRLATEFFDGIDGAVAAPAPVSTAVTSAVEDRPPLEEPRAAVRSGVPAGRQNPVLARGGTLCSPGDTSEPPMARTPRAFGSSVAPIAFGLAGIIVGVLIGRRAARPRR